jgi:hypothetical protein
MPAGKPSVRVASKPEWRGWASASASPASSAAYVARASSTIVIVPETAAPVARGQLVAVDREDRRAEVAEDRVSASDPVVLSYEQRAVPVMSQAGGGAEAAGAGADHEGVVAERLAGHRLDPQPEGTVTSRLDSAPSVSSARSGSRRSPLSASCGQPVTDSSRPMRA